MSKLSYCAAGRLEDELYLLPFIRSLYFLLFLFCDKVPKTSGVTTKLTGESEQCCGYHFVVLMSQLVYLRVSSTKANILRRGGRATWCSKFVVGG